jgi:hypothetical protein
MIKSPLTDSEAVVSQMIDSFLQSQRPHLLDRMEPQPVIDVLRSAKVLTTREEERVNAGATRTDRARILIHLVERKGPSVGMGFITAVQATHSNVYESHQQGQSLNSQDFRPF